MPDIILLSTYLETKNALLTVQLDLVLTFSQTICAENVQFDKRIVSHVTLDLKMEFRYVKNVRTRDI